MKPKTQLCMLAGRRILLRLCRASCVKMKVQSLSTQPHADGKLGEAS